jgi:hypothetical protein
MAEVLLGKVGVDSGTLLVCDPSYISEWVESDDSLIPKTEGEFSMAGCFEASDRIERGGQLKFSMGHDGAGVAFSSGIGDGFYEVWATIEEVPGWGERITSIRIDLMSHWDQFGGPEKVLEAISGGTEE